MSSEAVNRLRAVWGTSASDAFAVGDTGTIFHYNGSVWSKMTSPSSSDLYGLWGSGISRVYAVGWHGVIVLYNGSAWSEMTSGSTRDLWGVWGSSETDLFAVGESGTILRFISSPTVSTGSATSERTDSATLNGTVNPNGYTTTYYFEYGTTTSYGSTTAQKDAGSGTDDISISTDITGLTKDTTYQFRLVATNEKGTTNGANASFTTAEEDDKSWCFIGTAAFGF